MPDQTPDNAGVRIPPPLIYAVPLLAAWWLELHWALPFAEGPSRLGWLVILIGAVVMGSAAFNFRRAGTSPVPVVASSALVITGPYRWTRNPMYLGMLLGYVGVTLLLHSWWPVIFLPVVFWALNAYVIRREERYLEARFDEAYRGYKARVRRWI